MFGMSVRTVDQTRRVENAAEGAQFRNFFHGAAAIRKDAAASIERADGPSQPGTPPHTHRRIFLRRSIRFAASKEGAIIGTAASVVGTAGEAHEFGGEFRGDQYPPRPFMFPALERQAPRFAESWRGSIGE